jgi:GT2 family glycosyltransferase
MAPAVSVVIPCYNLGQFLDEAVDSVLAQTFDDAEVLVVDDGSTDPATRELIARYQRPRTRVIATAHAGLAAARNRGIAEASGRYLCALDADDRLEPRFLEKTVAVLDQDPSVAFASTWLRTFGAECWDWTPERCDLPALLRENTVLTAALVRRDAVLAVGGFDTAMPVQGDEDWDLWLTLVERGYRGAILPEVLFAYRRRPGSMSTICWNGPGHVPLAAYRVAKHADTYRMHLTSVLAAQDAEIGELLRDSATLEEQIATDLAPQLERRRDELARLQARLAGPAAGATDLARERIGQLEAALASAEHEVASLRASMSWRVTAPLRAVYGWWLRRGKAL